MVKKISILIIGLIVLLFSFCNKSPEIIGDWRIEIAQPSNEFYEDPGTADFQRIPPSEDILDLIKHIVPSYTQMIDWDHKKENKYWIRFASNIEKYDFIIFTDGTIEDITYKNDSTNVREKAYSLLIKDTKKEVSLEELPKKALETINYLFPGTKPSSTWIGSTYAGKRYIIVTNGMAFYARPDGQIQSARFTNSGGLEENYSREGNYSKEKNDEIVLNEIQNEADSLLAKYKERFDFDNQIKQIQKQKLGPGSSFRFIIMGDSRSNEGLWNAELKHINSLDPKPAFVINSGDLVPRGFVKEYHDYFVKPLLDFDIPYLVAIGNHDTGYQKKAREYRYLFGENSLNYYFDYGSYRFVVLDNVTMVNSVMESVAWLEKILAETDENMKIIVTAHSPMGNVEKWKYHTRDYNRSEKFDKLMIKHNVDHVFFGHIHAYSTATWNGIDYTVSGGSGAGLHDRFGPMGNVHHYIICDVLEDGSLQQQVVQFKKK